MGAQIEVISLESALMGDVKVNTMPSFPFYSRLAVPRLNVDDVSAIPLLMLMSIHFLLSVIVLYEVVSCVFIGSNTI
jgi:hypothetical protein